MDVSTAGSSASATSDQSNEIMQALLLKKSLRLTEDQQLALIQSARATSPSQPLDGSLVGGMLNTQA
jgi:hypothetical protein